MVADKTSSHWPLTLTNGAVAVLNLFLPLGLVRILTTDQMGRYKIFFLYLMLAPGLFLVSGLNNGLYHWMGKYPETKSEIKQSWTLLVGITALFCFLGFIVSPWLAPALKMSTRDLGVLLLSVLFIVGSAYMEDLLIARGDIWLGSLYGSGFNMLKAVSILGVAWWTHSVEWVIWIFFAGMVIRLLTGWILLARSGEIHFSFSFDKTAPVLRYALPVSIAALSETIFQNMDQMILSIRLSPERFAFYAIGCLAVPPLEIFASSVNRILIPKLSRSFSTKEPGNAASLFAEGVAELFRFLLPATVGLILYSRPIILMLFTERYLPAVPFLRFYALIYLFFALPYDSVARARGDGRWILRTSLLFAPLSIGSIWLAANHWGAMGALLAFVATQFLLRLYSLDYQRRCFESGYSTFLPLKEMLRNSLIALLVAVGAYFMRPLFSNSRTWFLVTGPLFTAVYFSALYAFHVWNSRGSKNRKETYALA